MLPAEITIQLDDKAVQAHIEKQLDAAIQKSLWWVDAKRISELTSMPKRTLEQEILSDCRMRAIEVRKSQKRYWPAQIAFTTINEILSEW